jgi:hypothetical protein
MSMYVVHGKLSMCGYTGSVVTVIKGDITVNLKILFKNYKNYKSINLLIHLI